MIGVRDAANHFQLTEETIEYVSEASYLHISGYTLQDEPGRSTTREFIRKAVKRGVEVSLDLTPEVSERRMVRGQGIQYLLCNDDELRFLCYNTHEGDLMRASRDMEIKAIVVKLGKRGCTALLEGKYYRGRGFEIRVVNTTGAGDAFNADSSAAS